MLQPLPTVYVSSPPMETNNNSNKGFIPWIVKRVKLLYLWINHSVNSSVFSIPLIWFGWETHVHCASSLIKCDRCVSQIGHHSPTASRLDECILLWEVFLARWSEGSESEMTCGKGIILVLSVFSCFSSHKAKINLGDCRLKVTLSLLNYLWECEYQRSIKDLSLPLKYILFNIKDNARELLSVAYATAGKTTAVDEIWVRMKDGRRSEKNYFCISINFYQIDLEEIILKSRFSNLMSEDCLINRKMKVWLPVL